MNSEYTRVQRIKLIEKQVKKGKYIDKNCKDMALWEKVK